MNLNRGINLEKIADKMTGASGAECKVRLLNFFISFFFLFFFFSKILIFFFLKQREFAQKQECSHYVKEEFMSLKRTLKCLLLKL